ncbi:MAG: 30S ribosomal protein S9 [Anaerolineae bacterium]|nr:30S ribosomal protein S9 [Anaerolineae bacterium]
MAYYEGVGRRKTATARVRLYTDGELGTVQVNGRAGEEYFTRLGDLDMLMAPLEATGLRKNFFVSVHVSGGGVTGQSDAVRNGVARALVKSDPELRSALRKSGFLTRDPRIKERKKPGLKRARKAPQYTKR